MQPGLKKARNCQKDPRYIIGMIEGEKSEHVQA
jgi:hypothetical protein